MSEVFVVVTSDTHGGTGAVVFEKNEDAIRYAVELEKRHPIDEEMNAAMINDGWTYYKCYDSGESHVFVAKREVK